MFDEPFAHGISLVHSFDPRFRLGVALLAAVCLSFLRSAEAACFALALGAGLLALGQPPLGHVLRRILGVNIFIFFLWLTVPFYAGGEALARWGEIEISRAGVVLAALVTLKANAMLFFFVALVASMTSPTMGHALAHMRVPSKLVFLLVFTYRYIHVVVDEWSRLHLAARLRGFRPCTDWHSYRTIGNMLGMILVGSLERASRVYEAMLLRGFSGQFQSVATFHARPRDVVFALLALLGMALIIWIDICSGVF